MRPVTLAVLSAMLIRSAGFTHAASAPPATQPVQISIVHTWGELRNQPVIDLGKDGKVQLGIEANHARQGAGLLIYVLTMADLPHCSDVGPLTVTFWPKGSAIELDKRMQELTKRQLPPGTARCLYVQSVALSESKDYSLVLWLDDPRQPVATATIKCDGTAEQYWYPLCAPAEKLAEQAHAPGELSDSSVLDTSIPVVPQWSGTAPSGFEKSDRDPSPQTPLPTMLPDATDAKLTIDNVTAKDLDLTLQFPKKIVIGYLRDILIARYWVNDKSIAIEPKDFQINETGGPSAAEQLVSKCRVNLKFDAEQLGAKPGDTLGIQLCVCRGRWTYLRLQTAQMDLFKAFDEPMVRLSDRADIKLP